MPFGVALRALLAPGSERSERPGPGQVARVLTSACVALSLVFGDGPDHAPALASSRPYMPLTVIIAGADVIAAVQAGSATPPAAGAKPSERLRVVVLRTFKGTLAEPEVTLVLKPYQRDLVYRFEAGSEHVVFMAPTAIRGEYRLTDETLLPHDEEQATRLSEAIPLVPSWSTPVGGLETVLVPDHEPATSGTRDPFRYRVSEPVLIWAGYRNASRRDIRLRYRDWPLSSHTHWVLRVNRAGGGEVESLPHPHVDAGEIRTFFSRNSHRFDYTLKPGEAFFLYLDRVNVAEAGWGYRERLDFRYYPMSYPGEYAISAVARFLHAGPPVTSRPFRIRVE